MTPVYDSPRSGRHHLHLDVFPAHLPLEVLGHAAVPGILLGHRGQPAVGRLILDERDKDQFFLRANEVLGGEPTWEDVEMEWGIRE